VLVKSLKVEWAYSKAFDGQVAAASRRGYVLSDFGRARIRCPVEDQGEVWVIRSGEAELGGRCVVEWGLPVSVTPTADGVLFADD